jgi:hypothetical protein
LKGKPHAFESWSDYLSFSDTAHASILGASSLHHNKPFRTFGMIQPAMKK